MLELPVDLTLDLDQFTFIGKALTAEFPETVQRPVRKGKVVVSVKGAPEVPGGKEKGKRKAVKGT